MTKITINKKGEIKVELFMVVLMKKHSMKVVMLREAGIKTLMGSNVYIMIMLVL